MASAYFFHCVVHCCCYTSLLLPGSIEVLCNRLPLALVNKLPLAESDLDQSS